MRLLERQSTATLPGHDPGASLRLRVGADRQLVDLPLGKTTIGSGARCSVRIQQPGIQPLHCLIVREGDGLSVRRWGANTLLNGVPFDESALRAGDCLQVASIDLEVVGPTIAPKPVPPSPAATHPTNPASADRVHEARELARSRGRMLLAALRRERSQHDDELGRQIAAFHQQIEQATAERSAIASERQKALADLAEAQRLAGDRQSLDVRRQELGQDNERLGGEVRGLTERLDQLSSELAIAGAARQALADENVSLVESQRRLLDENSQRREREQQLSRQVAELGGERERLAAEIEGLRSDLQSLGGEKAALADERAALRSQQDELRAQNDRLQADTESLASEKATLTAERATLCREREALSQRVESLRAEMQALSAARDAQEQQQAVLCGERDGYRQQCEHLHADFESLAAEKAALAEERAAVCAERDELRKQNFHLQEQLQAVAAEKSAVAEERGELCCERDQLREQNEHLQAGIARLDEEIAALTTAKAAFEEERNWLREENNRYADVERQMRSAVADRENISAELYRVLLQAAELQKGVDRYDVLCATHESLLEEHDELSNRLAELQLDVERLDHERTQVADSQQKLTEETAVLREDRQRLADENAQLISSLGEVRQHIDDASRQRAEIEARLQQDNTALREQLDEARRGQAELAEKLGQWERELADQRNTDRSADAAIEDTHRVIAEQSQRIQELTELLQTHEQELAAARDAQRALENQCDAWQGRYTEATQQLAQRAARSAELESELAAAATAPQAAPAQSSPVEESQDNSQPLVDMPAEIATMHAEPRDEEGSQLADGERPAEIPSPTSQLSDANVDSGEENDCAVEAPRAAEAEAETLARAERHREPELETRRQPSLEEVAPSSPATSQAAASSGGRQSTSYIERYSHLFEDEETQDLQSKSKAPSSATGSHTPEPRLNQPAQSATAQPLVSSGDEESIEQYMTKLLERTRGQSAGPADQAARSEGAQKAQPVRRSLAANEQSAESPAPGVTAPPAAFSWANFTADRQKNSTPAPKTDLEALRALANESARRAISRHALRKLRRNTLTKAIVATLAGMTSLWLILESADWRSMQCITAGVTLLIAAYWAGQTYGTLLETLRERASDEPDEEPNQPFGVQSPLPIDVDRPELG